MTWEIIFEPDREIYIVNTSKNIKKAILIIGPSAREWAYEVLDELKDADWEVEILNEGVEYEYDKANRVLSLIYDLLEVVGV